jgi:hypothetical protein
MDYWSEDGPFSLPEDNPVLCAGKEAKLFFSYANLEESYCKKSLCKRFDTLH